MDTIVGKSPPAPLCQRGVIPPFGVFFLSLDRQREVRRDFIKISLGLWFISMSALLWTD
jgi:hypothetical protein